MPRFILHLDTLTGPPEPLNLPALRLRQHNRCWTPWMLPTNRLPAYLTSSPRLLVVSLSCLQIGVWKHKAKPIRVLARGLSATSLVRYGSEHLRNALRWDPGGSAELFALLILPLSAPGAA